ncbi:MAG TPA: hypothetical protein VF631_03775 [Allosphingosinicella sp.]|uniref:hypothetical protein n=1 Tax=Allosphingosinicella sp. TaxID=2823234 RepID=UPI002F276394
MSPDLLLFGGIVAGSALLFAFLPPFFGGFFFVGAVAVLLWLRSMHHSPDSPGLGYGVVVFCVGLGAILAEAMHLVRWLVKRRRPANG